MQAFDLIEHFQAPLLLRRRCRFHGPYLVHRAFTGSRLFSARTVLFSEQRLVTIIRPGVAGLQAGGFSVP